MLRPGNSGLYIMSYFKIIGLLLFSLAGINTYAQKAYNWSIYYDYNDYSGVLFSSDKNPDSLNFKLSKTKWASKDELIFAAVNLSNGEDLLIKDIGGAYLGIDAEGDFYVKDVVGSDTSKKYVDLNIKFFKLGLQNLVIEVLPSDFPFFEIRVQKQNDFIIGANPKITTYKFNSEDWVTLATGILSPTRLSELADKIKFEPEDRKILDSLVIVLPTKDIPPGKFFTVIIYDMGKNIVKMIPNIKTQRVVLLRENLVTGVYIGVIYYQTDNELKRVFLHLQQSPKIE